MATNISLLLKEESYFQFVVDPAGGAYAMDALTDTIIERTWSTFQEIERMGGLTQTATRDFYSERISEKAALRKEQLSNKTEQLIGINVFLNPESITNDWQEVPLAWNGLPSLILEKA
jgi:methylmalonyl-CoA mutase